MDQAPPPSYESATIRSNAYYNGRRGEYLQEPIYDDDDTEEQDTAAEDAATPQETDLDQRDKAIVAATLRWLPPAPCTPPQRQALPRPVAIPRLDIAGFRQPPLPFLRAYAPLLARHHISRDAFAAFVDGLSVAQAPAPPLQALSLAGGVVGALPLAHLQLVGAGLQGLAGVGSAVASARRTRLFLDRVNGEFFGPRGLRARIVKDGELARAVGFPVGRPALA